MFKLTMDECSVLRDSLDAVSNLVNEGTFKLEPDGIGLVAMDSANVAMIIFKILSSAFTSYSLDVPKNITLNISQLVSILKRAKAKDSIIIKLDEELNKLKITMRSNLTRTFSMPLIEAEEEEQKVPSLTFTSKVELEAGVIGDAVKDASMVADSVILETKEDKFIMRAAGDTNDVKTELTKDSPSLINISGEGARAKYSIEYLDKMIKAAKVADTLILQFANDFPLQLEYKALDKVSLTFILAPRVDND